MVTKPHAAGAQLAVGMRDQCCGARRAEHSYRDKSQRKRRTDGLRTQATAAEARHVADALALTTILIENLKYFDPLFDYYFDRKPKVF